MGKRSASDSSGMGSGIAKRPAPQPTRSSGFRGVNPTGQPGGGKTSREGNSDSLDPGRSR